MGNPCCISRKAKDLPREEWEGRWEGEACLIGFMFILLAYGILSEIFWGKNRAYWLSLLSREISPAPSLKASLSTPGSLPRISAEILSIQEENQERKKSKCF